MRNVENAVNNTASGILAANPATLLLVLAAGLLAGAFVGGLEFRQFLIDKENKALMKYIADINELHALYLTDMLPIFNKDGKDKKDFASINFTRAAMDDLRQKAFAGQEDPRLQIYKEEILGAISLFITYYDRIKGDAGTQEANKTNITMAIIDYYLHILEQCLGFSGTPSNIALIEKLQIFINAFADMPGDDHDQRFSAFSPIFQKLKNARIELLEHQNDKTQMQLIGEAQSLSHAYVDQSLKIAVQMIIPVSEWPLLENVSMSILKDGHLALEQTMLGFLGIHQTIAQHDLPQMKSPLTKRVIRLIQFHWASMKSSSPTIPSIEEIAFPGVITEEEINLVRMHFKTCPNLFTAKTIMNADGKPVEQPVLETSEIRDRMKGVFSQRNMDIYLEILRRVIMTNMTILGNIFGSLSVDDAKNYGELYGTFNACCDRLCLYSNALFTSFELLQKENLVPMKPFSMQMFEHKFEKILSGHASMIASDKTLIRERRKNSHIRIQAAVVLQNTEKLLDAIKAVCHFDTPPQRPPNMPEAPRRIPIPPTRESHRSEAALEAHAETPAILRTPNTVIPIKFPPKYPGLFQQGINKSIDANATQHYSQLIFPIRALLNEYRENALLHLTRHHIKFVSDLVAEIDPKLEAIRKNPANQDENSLKGFLEDMLQQLNSRKNEPQTNQRGAFATMVDYIAVHVDVRSLPTNSRHIL